MKGRLRLPRFTIHTRHHPMMADKEYFMRKSEAAWPAERSPQKQPFPILMGRMHITHASQIAGLRLYVRALEHQHQEHQNSMNLSNMPSVRISYRRGQPAG